MARKRTRRADPDAPYELLDHDHETDARSGRQRRPQPAPRRRGSWSRRIVLLGLFVVATIGLLPTIISNTPLRQTALNLAGNAIGLQLEATQLSAGWMSTPTITNLVIRDRQGQPLMEAEQATIDRTLLDLLQDRSNLGLIHLHKARAHVSVREDGNNWQDALTPLLQSDSGDKTPTLKLQVTEGHVHLQDDRHLRSWDAAPVELTVIIDESNTTPIAAQLSTSISDSRGKSGQVQLAVHAADKQFSNVLADINTQHLPLALLQPVLSAIGSDLQLSGDANMRSNLKLVTRPETRAQMTLQALDVRDFSATSSQLPMGDAIHFAQLTGSGDMRWEDGNVLADNLKLQSDVASITANGRLKWEHLATRQLDERDEVALAAQVDLSRLAAMMPNTLRIKQGTQINSGTVQATLNSRTEQGLRVWHGIMNASGLAATNGGQQVKWEHPVSIELDATQRDGQWSVRKLDCISSFLNVTGSGRSDSGRLELSGDLDRLRTELSQFVNLGDIRMAGAAQGNIHWQQTTAGMNAQGELNLTKFQLDVPGKAPLTEEQLELKFQGRGQVDRSGNLTQVDHAQATLSAAGDAMNLQLLAPVSVGLNSIYPIRTQVSGDLGRWAMRVAVLTGNSNLRGDGALEFDAEMQVSSNRVSVRRSTLKAAPFKIAGLPMPIDEPQLTAEIVGDYDMGLQRWSGGDSNVVSATFAARCGNLVVQPDRITGDIACRGSLERIMRLLGIEKPEVRYQGEFSGAVHLVQADAQTQFTIQQRLNNFVVLRHDVPGLRTVASQSPWRTSWSEPFVDVNAVGVYEPGANLIRFEQLKVGLDSASVAVAGQLSELDGRVQSDLNGQLSYDLQRLTQKLKPLTGESILLEGVSDKPISIRGPLRPPTIDPSLVATQEQPLLPLDLTANAGFGWDSATIEGFRVGAGQINTSLEQATVRFDGMQIPVSQGKIMLAPQVSFRSASPVLTVPPGPVIERLMISQEMTSTWMKYVAPMLAEATRIDGTFSATVDQMKVPLTDPKSGTLKGQMTIHGAKVGPGPLAQQLLQMVQQADNLIKGAGEGVGSVDFNRAVELLNNGALLNQRGGLDPKRAFGALLGGSPATAGAETAANTVWLSVPEHEINYHVDNQRVHHEGMRMSVDNVEVQTSGSVGFDETLNMVAEMKIPDAWIGNNAQLASLKGMALRIPVGGTIRQPRLDQTAFQHLARQLFATAANGAIGGALGGGIFGQGPAGQGGIPNMTPTGDGTVAPPSSESQPATVPPSNLQQRIDGAAGNAQKEVDRAFNKLFRQ